ncbi:protein SRG1-like [Coffea arabica]|uniref:Protein SRG1-like n=1 Tax=Coffea arabica TaxID=13443 RepID=A0A6P6UE58_COFAR|nr:protein SRG1-like [Coffea arabica]
MAESPLQFVNFGKSLVVPSVQELAKQPISKIPPRYVHHDEESPIVSHETSLPAVPVIDVERLLSENSMDSELEKLHLACKDWGFFQVVNHGLSTSLLDCLRNEITDFFKLPFEEKKALWQEPENHEGFGQLFVVSEEQKLDWSDMFYITTLPDKLRKVELFEKLPRKLRDAMEAYSLEVKILAMTLLREMAKVLKIDEEEMKGLFSDGVQSMRMNYYPPCPEPEMAIGFNPHSDAVALTILFQLNGTPGLQIRKDGKWLPVTPLPDALIVNVGDIIEILSNGLYRSIEHRATVNSDRERLSIATFYSSNLDAEVAPARSLIGPHNPAVFRSIPVEKFFREFFAAKLNGKAHLEFMKIQAGEHQSC